MVASTYNDDTNSRGPVRLENPGPGLPLNALPTPTGLRVLGQKEGPAAPEARQAVPQAEPAPAGGDPVDELAHRLYQRLEDHLLDLDRAQTERLLRRVLSEVAAAPPAQPQPQEAAPQPDLLAQLEAELDSEPALAPPPAPEPPPLSPAEVTLEERLRSTALKDYRDRRWFERTREFSEIWDRARRRRLGLLGTYFSSFKPRWECPEWAEFNLGRRQADARGANYDQWIRAQFQRLQEQGREDVLPGDLHGEEAIRAYQASLPAEAQQVPELGPPPFTAQSFDINNPEHVTYAEAMLDQLADLAASVYGDDPQGPVALAVEAVKRGNLPVAALELRPEWKPRVLAALTPAQRAAQVYGSGGHPPLII